MENPFASRGKSEIFVYLPHFRGGVRAKRPQGAFDVVQRGAEIGVLLGGVGIGQRLLGVGLLRFEHGTANLPAGLAMRQRL